MLSNARYNFQYRIWAGQKWDMVDGSSLQWVLDILMGVRKTNLTVSDISHVKVLPWVFVIADQWFRISDLKRFWDTNKIFFDTVDLRR